MKSVLVDVSDLELERNGKYFDDIIIMIVDEDEESSNCTKRFLDNYFCIECFYYEEVIASYKLRKDRISLIILEEKVGTVTGAAIAKQIRELENYMTNPRTPIISISINSLQRQTELYAGIDVDAFFIKPLSQNILLTISQLLHIWL